MPVDTICITLEWGLPFGLNANGERRGGFPLTPGQLVRAVSIALDVPEETVVQHDRNLVVAGLRTRGGRGRSAPEVTPLDAARLLAATLASVRAKDSVETVEALGRAQFDPSRPTYEVTYIDADGLFVPQISRLQDAAKHRDIAIASLPATHNFIDGLAALIADASGPIDDFQLFVTRFSKLGISCSSPVGQASLGNFARYSVPVEPTPNQAPKLADIYFFYGIHQDRKVAGTAIMVLGAAFRDNGPRYANAYEAHLAGYGTKKDKPKKPAKMVQWNGDR
jgi:hypothetical protein